LYHVAKKGGTGSDVCSCDKKIDKESAKEYDRLLALKDNKRKSKEASTDTLNSSITTHNVSVASKLDAAQKKARPNSSNERGSGSRSDNSNTTSTNHSVASFLDLHGFSPAAM